MIDYRYIRITDITSDGQLNDDFHTAKNIENKYILEDGDVLFARSGNTVGKTFLYKSSFGKAIYAGYLIRFKPLKEFLLPKFLEILTKGDVYKKWVADSQTGSSQPNINGQLYSNFMIPVPPLTEQEKIVQQIEALEMQIAQAQQVIDAAPQQKQAILQKYL
ncbi:hypothetical protein BJN41_08010 [Acinetobacter towneri]|uniref:Type I restriction modification DNA specificity domain-containing protein n=1 Tax=Acinetobacter towneri TaxID=202956 RepID=A0A1E8E4B6_9GAMM|nr:hypothetical protein BJN41_08010 [Acinetobacter towneri]